MRRLRPPYSLADRTRVTRVVLTTRHRHHDPTSGDAYDPTALCQRCHFMHDEAEHLGRWRLTDPARRAIGDLFKKPYG